MRLQLPTIIILCLSVIVIITFAVMMKSSNEKLTQGSSNPESQEIKGLREQAQMDHSVKKYPQAIQVYKDVLEMRPDNAEIHSDLGATYYEYGLEQAGPNWPSWESDLTGRTLNEALQELQTSIEQTGSGYIVLKVDRPETIQTIEKKAQEAGADLYVQRVGSRATINILIGETKELFIKAQGSYLRAIDLKPTYAPAYRNLGSLYMKMGRHDLAVDYLHKAHQLDPRDTELEEYLNQFK